MICISPILLVVTIWLHFANKGAGAFFFQERPGKDGKIFKVIKFKTMTDEKDADGNPITVDDNSICIYEMENGVVGTMTASWTYYGAEDNSTVIYGTNGMMRIYDDPEYSIVVTLKDGSQVLYDIDRIQTNDNQTKSGIIDAWVESLVENKDPEISGKSVLSSMKAIFAALESSKSNTTVVIE